MSEKEKYLSGHLHKRATMMIISSKLLRLIRK